MRPVLAIGWDVGGWHGGKQAVAVAAFDGRPSPWLGEPALFSIPRLQSLGGSALELARFAWPDAPDDMFDHWRVVIAIDAPLGFPDAFVNLLTASDVPDTWSGSFFENPMAFRTTERWIVATYGKRPLSAPFDKLGNNAVTAIAQAKVWSKRHRFRIAPQHDADSEAHTIIEVYPALVKRPGTTPPECFERFARLLPEVSPGTDQYDAAICAVLAAAYGANGTSVNPLLPPLVSPPADIPRAVIKTEGWIYAVSLDWLHAAV